MNEKTLNTPKMTSYRKRKLAKSSAKDAAIKEIQFTTRVREMQRRESARELVLGACQFVYPKGRPTNAQARA